MGSRSGRVCQVGKGWLLLLLLSLALTCPLWAAPAPAPSNSAPASSPVAEESTRVAPGGAASKAVPSTAPSARAANASPAPTVEEPPPRFVPPDEINWSHQIAITLGWLGVLLVGIWIVLRFLYGRFGTGSLRVGVGRQGIQVIDRHVLGPQKALLIVSVPGKVLLIGMTDQHISTLSELRPEDFNGARPASNAGRPENPPQTDDTVVNLASLFGKKSSKGESPE